MKSNDNPFELIYKFVDDLQNKVKPFGFHLEIRHIYGDFEVLLWEEKLGNEMPLMVISVSEELFYSARYVRKFVPSVGIEITYIHNIELLQSQVLDSIMDHPMIKSSKEKQALEQAVQAQDSPVKKARQL